MRRSILLATAATAAALAALTGCDGGDPAPSVAAAVPGAFDPAQAVANAGKEPYAVSVRATGEPDGGVITARQNLNTVNTGRREQKRADGTTLEFVTTADAEFIRGHDASGSWLKTRRSSGASEFDFGGFAPLLLAQGPAARKGMETRDGVPVYHLAGHLGLEQLAQASAPTHAMAKVQGLTGIDLDQWIDAQGRTRYVEERMVLEGKAAVARMTFSDFGPAETFDAPTGTIV
ncbi:hypothetical protein P3T27_002420 [Kitasatospora sp. MAA19]|uniref:hypothetical protein n=1 Tax=Kitasatospora sp. MAA19 TaxID=3035090 RepID=UPI0024747ED3|nr:hypothetical protein [Kitasatospora sp. MAA19]MDH6705698.1 hypothetical protein [Kitasatospora sp. MAA19]